MSDARPASTAVAAGQAGGGAAPVAAASVPPVPLPAAAIAVATAPIVPVPATPAAAAPAPLRAAVDTPAAPLLEVHAIRKHFGGVHAVDGLGFSLAAGEFAALIGPNGAGKSTLFGLIAGQYRPDGGDLRFDGRSIARLPAPARAHAGIGRTFQTAQAWGTLSARENLQLALAVRAGHTLRAGRALRGQHGAAADALLARMGLTGAAARAAADLPYPDLKRLELAIALAGRPRLLLMDEPTAGMAAAERFALMDLVRDLVAQHAGDGGLTVLFTEHSMEVVFGYARRVLVMARGRLIADGAPEAVRRDPAAQAAYFGGGEEADAGDPADRDDRRRHGHPAAPPGAAPAEPR